MNEVDIEMVVQRAFKIHLAGVTPRTIGRNFPQFLANDFRAIVGPTFAPVLTRLC